MTSDRDGRRRARTHPASTGQSPPGAQTRGCLANDLSTTSRLAARPSPWLLLRKGVGAHAYPRIPGAVVVSTSSGVVEISLLFSIVEHVSLWWAPGLPDPGAHRFAGKGKPPRMGRVEGVRRNLCTVVFLLLVVVVGLIAGYELASLLEGIST